MKKNMISGCTSAFVMLGLPWAAVAFVSPYSAMIACVLMLYVINPICACLVGAFAGKGIGSRWYHPLLCSVFFALGAWLFLQMGCQDILWMSCVYLGLGYASAFAGWLMKKR